MSSVLEYLKNILVIMIFCLPIYYIIRFKILKINTNNKRREWMLLLFILYMIALTIQIITPKYIINFSGIELKPDDLDNINIIPFYLFVDLYNECIVLKNFDYLFINIFGNILLFIPIGIFLPLLWNIEYKKVLLYGILFSIFVEIIQIWLPRVTDIDDVILNNIGVYIGILIHKKYINKTNKQKRKSI